MWFSYEEGGYQTIGYGHELSREENTNGLEIDGLTFFAKKGLSDTQIQRLLEIDLAMACLYAQRVVVSVPVRLVLNSFNELGVKILQIEHSFLFFLSHSGRSM